MARCVAQGNERVFKLVRTTSDKLSHEVRYRLSGFCISYSEGEVYLLKHMLTRQVMSLDKSEWDALNILRDSAVEYAYLESHGLIELAERRCLVAEDYNECEEYLFVLRVLKTMRKPADGIKCYVVFPTTACNARCTYCYEQDFVPVTMTEETILATVDYIDRTRWSGPIKMRWFGGEPLVAASRIDRICEELQRRDIQYESNFITNGSLLTPELVQRAWDLWHLRSAQVSLDGCRADFEFRKRFATPLTHNYDTVMRGIHLLADQGIGVRLRCNFDEDNIEGLQEFVDDLGREFAGTKNVRLYFALLFQAREKPNAPELIRRVREVEDRAAELGILGEIASHKGVSFRTHMCMADDLARYRAVDPKGQLQHCEHLDDANIFGNVWEDITDQARYDELAKPYEVEECCRVCPFIPLCTPTRKRGCPDGGSDYCREIHMAEEEGILHRIAVKLAAEAAPDVPGGPAAN